MWIRGLAVIQILGLTVSHTAAQEEVYTWPHSSVPTFSAAECASGDLLQIPGVTTYAEAKSYCEATGCTGLMYFTLVTRWYTCSSVLVSSVSSLSGYVPTITTTEPEFVSWAPKPASTLASTAYSATLQSNCQGLYMGHSCTERTCAFGLSLSASPYLSSDGNGDDLWAPLANQYTGDSYNGRSRAMADGGTHSYAECSGRGTCDRQTGLCACADGYTGKGCRRTTCPTDCSGHGVCKRNIDINSDYDWQDASGFRPATQYWDATQTMRCDCDRGFSGADCSERICPFGDDVLTTCAVDSNYDVQVVAFTDPGDALAAAMAVNAEPLYYTLTFTDHFSGTYTTSPIAMTESAAQNAQTAQRALESLPNSAIPSVQVSSDVDALTVSISFTDAATSGQQQTLVAAIRHDSATCSQGGHMPYTQNDATFDGITVAVSHQALASAESEYEEHVPCGNRGICDKSIGKCDCFEGHTGEACEIQSVFV